MSRIFGFEASVRAIATRWRMPPESCDGMMALEAGETDERHVLARAPHALLARHTRDLERKGDVLLDRAPGKGRLLLEHHADRGVRTGDRLAFDDDAAFVLIDQSADDVEQRRLAAARRSDDRQHFARRDVERHAIDRGDRLRAVAEALDEVVHFEDGAHFAARFAGDASFVAIAGV